MRNEQNIRDGVSKGLMKSDRESCKELAGIRFEILHYIINISLNGFSARSFQKISNFKYQRILYEFCFQSTIKPIDFFGIFFAYVFEILILPQRFASKLAKKNTHIVEYHTNIFQ